MNQIPASKVVAWIKQHFPDYKTRKDGSEILIRNPFSGSSKFNMNINPEMGLVHNWSGDEWAGPIVPGKKHRGCTFLKLVRLYKQCSYRDALRDVLGASADLKSYLNIAGRIDSEVPDVDITVTLPRTATPLISRGNDTQANLLVSWLHRRGYTDQEIEDDDLYYSGVEVFWPYYEFDQLVYWQSRSYLNKRFNFPPIIVKEDGKAIGKTEGSKGDYLYGFDNVKPASFLIISEAIFDKTMLGKQAVASGGAILTSRQIEKIKMIGPKDGIILAPDNDAAGLKSILSNAELLEPLGYKLYYAIPKSIKYVKDGEAGVTKDYNEMFTHAQMSRDDIFESFESSVQKLDFRSKFKIRELITWMERNV